MVSEGANVKVENLAKGANTNSCFLAKNSRKWVRTAKSLD